MDPELAKTLAAAAGVPVDPETGPDTDTNPALLDFEDPAEKRIEREAPEPDEARRKLVLSWQERVRAARNHWDERAFKQMKADMRFCAGAQWPDSDLDKFTEARGDRYVANITLRHVAQRTANLYGKNPKVVARRRRRLLNTVWDGTQSSLAQALQSVSAFMQAMQDPTLAAQAGPMGALGALDPQALAVVMDAQNVKQQEDMVDRICKTLEVLFEWQLEEQVIPFKKSMKAMVRRALTTGVGYLKLGFQRAMALSPDVERQLADYSERLATVERIAADIADGEVAHDDAEAEQLRLAIQALSETEQIIVREGLVFDWPDSWAIIPDMACKSLHGFVGSDWVAEQFMLTEDRIEEIYKVDVCKSATAYNPSSETGADTLDARIEQHFGGNKAAPGEQSSLYAVWQVYSKKDGLVYTLCDGYPDFLEEPREPDTKTERFWPWFAFTTNDLYREGTPFPPSDVSLIRDPQLEFNRARQGLREHRRANRPKIFAAAGTLDDEDKDKLAKHPANAIIELNGLAPGQKIEDLLQPGKQPGVDPNLYDTSQAYHDIMSVVGSQEANLGPTSGATATESSIAESSRAAAVGSTVDDLDEMLTEVARVAGQVLLANMQKETVQKIVGAGAVWPDLTLEEIQSEVYLEIEAGSSGRPNRAQEVQNATQLMPILLQIPGLSPEWIARELIRRMDDRLDMTDAFAAGMPSIQALNRIGQMLPKPPGEDPNAQGGEGGGNAPSTDPGQTNAAPRPEAAGPPGQGVPVSGS